MNSSKSFVELVRTLIGFQRPQVNTRLSVAGREPSANSLHKRSAETSPLAFVRHVKIVDQRTPCAVLIPQDADKTQQLGIRLGDVYKLILPLASQTAAPDFEAVCDYITIQEHVTVRTAIGSSPAVRMKERYPLRIRSHGGSIMHAIHV